MARTRAAVTAALFQLIQERRWDRITVQDLLERADVSRSTFYAHYDNKLDVLTSGAPEVATRLVDPRTGKADLGPLFEHVAEVADVMAPLLSQPVLGEVAAALERSLADAYRQVVDERRSPQLATFLAGATIASMRTYVSLKRRPPPAAVAAELEAYVDAVLRCAADRAARPDEVSPPR